MDGDNAVQPNWSGEPFHVGLGNRSWEFPPIGPKTSDCPQGAPSESENLGGTLECEKSQPAPQSSRI